ncbi:flotillin family protein [Mucisphaera calidilacus]|uniref:Inner membrane protein YqiK n=1 Tax=Mucisphaera calidilacus TaxID=2527982 RepID=A0A518BYK6_9BACT|nr:flotillin family protein [Mucisphaera calidilacus]QDU72048.1 Inner membrane protein YqiK [Mucisphaera calidilacus]
MNGLLLGQGVLSGVAVVILIAVPVLLIFFGLILMITRYRRCPSNRILVVYGRGTGERSAKCVHGGGVFVWPVIQDYQYLSLEPITIEIELTSALSKKNIRVAVPSTFTIGISTEATIMQNAAERLLGLSDEEIATQARDIILGQMRLVIATLTIEEINQDREKFLDLVNKNVNYELNKIGLYMINVNIRDITDESGYITALGQKAAAEAINQAKIEVAAAEREGAIGTATANRERDVQVAQQKTASETGQKEAEREMRIKVAALEAQGISGEADAKRSQDVAVAEQGARTIEGQKQAEADQRIRVASLEANAVEGENDSKAKVASYEATLAEARAEARRRGDVALAQSARDVLMAEKEQELARMEKEVIAKEMIERQQVEISAEAEAERQRRIAKGEADAVLAKYLAEAEGIQKVLEAKAEGYRQLIETVGDRPELAPSLLIIEKLPELVAEQVKAISGLKIDKITVWDSGVSGESGTGSTGSFLRGLIGSLPPIHELAKQTGIDLPDYLGAVEEVQQVQAEKESDPPEDPATS